MVGESRSSFLLIAYEVYHHIGFVITDSDGYVAFVNDTQRNGGVWRSRTYFLDVWYAKNDEHPTVVVFVTGALVGVADV